MPPTPGVSGDIVAGNIQLNTLFYESAADNLTAHAGGGQAAALLLTAELNRVTTVATAADSVALPSTAAIKPSWPGGGLTILVENAGTNSMQVFGSGTDTINGVATATGVAQMAGSVVLYTCYSSGAWFTEGLATGYSGSLQTMSYVNNITALGTGQSNGVILTAMVNNVTTVASGTGANLPTSAAGLQIIVINNGANALLVYPAQGASDTINGVAATVGVSLFPGTVAAFTSTAAGAWTTQPGTTRMAAFNAVASATTMNLTAAQITGGAASVDLSINGVQAGAITANLPTVALMVAALHSPTVGTSYRLRVINSNTTQTITVSAAAAGWTTAAAPNNTLTIATATWREFDINLTSLSAATISSAATGTFS